MVKKIVLASFCLTALAVVAFAQGGPPFNPGNPNPVGVPVDGGVSLLIAFGAAYGAKRLKKPAKVQE